MGVSPCGSYLHVDTAANTVGGGRRVAYHAVVPRPTPRPTTEGLPCSRLTNHDGTDR